MKTLMTLMTALLIASLSPASARAEEPSTETLLHTALADCDAAYDLEDIAACPAAHEVVTLTDLSDAAVIARFEAENGFNLKRVDGWGAFRAMKGRLEQQLGFLEENYGSAGESQTVAAFGSMISGLRTALLAAEAQGYQLYADDDTYWAPSVNAAAVVLVNPATGDAITLMHGDTDG